MHPRDLSSPANEQNQSSEIDNLLQTRLFSYVSRLEIARAQTRSHRWNVLQGRQNAGRKDEGRWLGGQVHADGSAWFALHVFFSLYAICYHCILHVASCRALQYSMLQDHLSCCQLHHVTSRSMAWERSSSYIIIIISSRKFIPYLHETHHNCHQHTLLTHLGSYKVAVPQDGHRFMMIPTYPSILLGF